SVFCDLALGPLAVERLSSWADGGLRIILTLRRKGEKVSNSLLVSGSAILTLFLVMAAGGQPGYQAQVVYDRPKPEATPPAGHVAELIAVLSDDALEARRSARRALLAMGA